MTRFRPHLASAIALLPALPLAAPTAATYGNELRNDRLQRYFSRGIVERSLAHLMAMEEFGAGRISP